MCFKWIEYKEARILYQNFAGVGLSDSVKVREEFDMLREMILAQPVSSVRVLTNFNESYFGKDLMEVMIDHSKATKPYIKKMAAVGVTGPKRIMAGMVERLSGQPMTFFEDAETAQKWLAEG